MPGEHPLLPITTKREPNAPPLRRPGLDPAKAPAANAPDIPDVTHSRPRGLDWWDAPAALAIAALALVTRLHFLLGSPDRAWPHSAWFQGDAPGWAQWAGALAKGEEFEHGLAIHSPAVAYLLRWLGCSDATTDFTKFKVLWCVASALACALTYVAIRLEAKRRVAAIAAVLLAFTFASYETATSLNGETLYMLLVPLIVIGTIRLGRKPTLSLALVLGLVHGLASLIRPEHPLLVALLAPWFLWASRATVLRRRLAALAVMAVALVAVCVPWSIKTARATERFNTVAASIDFDHASPPWTPDARAYLNTLPAFAQADNFQYLSALAARRGLTEVNESRVREYFSAEFNHTPEPIPIWNLVSGQGPLCFALANHPSATGGFSKAALDARFGPDPSLMLGLPTDLDLYLHGYRIGLGYIRKDPAKWRSLVVSKLEIFAEGATQGFTARNWPLGRDGVRRAVDVFTARGRWGWWWQIGLGAVPALGLVVGLVRGVGGLWLTIILAKVITTILFFGYARQAASILPAFAVFGALGIDALLVLVAALVPPLQRLPKWAPALWLAPVAAVLVFDLIVGPPEGLQVTGNAREMPRFGPDAFDSSSDLSIQTSPAHAPRPGKPDSGIR